MESVPNGLFTTTCVPILDDDEDGLQLDFDSSEEGDREERDSIEKEGIRGGDGNSNSNHEKRGKRQCYKPKDGSEIHTYVYECQSC